ncbi:MAG: hypothetical protein M1835_006007 [Candelina submexicana]|nr:MAG: hypothetical protein M1835_006007 [Candelina submexicana]
MPSVPPPSNPKSKDLPHSDEFELESDKTWPTEDPLGMNQTLEEINSRGPSIDDVYDSASGTFGPRVNAAAVENSEDNINTETGPNRCGTFPMTTGPNSRSGNPSTSPPLNGCEQLLGQNLSYFDQELEAILGCGTQGSFAEDDGQGLPVYDPNAAPVDDSEDEPDVNGGVTATRPSATQGCSELMKSSANSVPSANAVKFGPSSRKRKTSPEQDERDGSEHFQKRARIEATGSWGPSKSSSTRSVENASNTAELPSLMTGDLEPLFPQIMNDFPQVEPSRNEEAQTRGTEILFRENGVLDTNADSNNTNTSCNNSDARIHNRYPSTGPPLVDNRLGTESEKVLLKDNENVAQRFSHREVTAQANPSSHTHTNAGDNGNPFEVNARLRRSSSTVNNHFMPAVLTNVPTEPIARLQPFPRYAVTRGAPVARMVASPASSSRSQPAASAHPPPVASHALGPPSVAGSTSVQPAATTANPVPSSRKRKASTEDQTGQHKKAKTEESPNVDDNDTDAKPTQGKRVGTKRGGYSKTPAHMYEWTDPVTGRKPKIQMDFPTPDQPLPRGRSYDYIMTHYPNHVDGLLCLEMYDRGVPASEMARKSGGNRFNHTNYVHRCKSLVEKRFPLRNWEVEKHCKWDRAKKAQVYGTDLQPYGVAHPRELLPFPGSATHMLAGPRYQTPQEEQNELLRIQRKQQQDSQAAQHYTLPPTQVPQQQLQSTSQTSSAGTQAEVDLNAPDIPSRMPDDSFSSGVDGHEGSFGDDQIDNLDEGYPQDGYFPQDTIYDNSDGEDQVDETSEDAWLIQLLSEANRALDQQNKSSSGSNGEGPSQGKYPEPGWGTPHGHWDNFGIDPNSS